MATSSRLPSGFFLRSPTLINRPSSKTVITSLCDVVTIATDFELKSTDQYVSKVLCDPFITSLLS